MELHKCSPGLLALGSADDCCDAAWYKQVLRSYEEMKLLDRTGHRFVILELQHFIFFGSATQVLDLVKGIVESQHPTNMATHVRYVE